MLSMRRPGAALLVLMSLTAGAEATARAQPDDDAAARKAAGNEKMVDSDFVGAIEDYKAALALAPNDLALYYNLGRASGLLGRYPESLAAFETFAARASPQLRARIPSFDGLLAETRQHVAFLSITCSVPNARVQMDREVLGAAPLTRKAVNAGTATLRIAAEGYFDDVRPVTLAGASELSIECRLLPKSTSGTLAVTSAPLGARISIDGAFRGNDRVELPLKAGPHVVASELDGYRTRSTTFLMSAGSVQKLELSLQPKPVAITSRWWFWSGVGLVVAGAVVATVAALTEKPADHGSIAPRQLGTPLTF